ncbi:MAG: DUF3857 and transglutaminase domain-containing protein [Bacteroidales bacterium]|nr:DUF3857 and transglutaminase domain-containing protein [Bacteroidales bacterium]
MKKVFAILGLTVFLTAAAFAQETARPGKYAGMNTLTRFDSTGVYVEESGLSHVLTHRRVEALTFNGCSQLSTIKMDYDPLSAYCEITHLLVHRAFTGTTDTLVWPGRENNVPIYDYVAPARMIYWGASQKMVEVGRVNLMDEVEVWTYKKGYTYALLADGNNGVSGLNGTFAALPENDSRYVPPMKGHFYDIVPFWSDQPVQHKVYQLNIQDSKSLRYQVYFKGMPYNDQLEIRRETADEEGRTLYTFSNKEDIMPLKREPRALANNDMQCKLLLSTSPDWQAKSRWFYGVNEDYGSFVPTPAVQKKVNELLVGAKDEMDSISRLTHWVADNIRYAGISMGEGEGFTLHNQEMNFTDRCGVCKDKASTLIGFLRAAGFKAYAAMTMAGERIDRIPADQFNHSVCAVQLRDGSFRMLDPTWVPNVRELWSSAEQQQGYLIGTAEGCDLMETPVSAPENHYIRIIGESAIDKNGTLMGTISVTAEGQSDASVRGVFGARQSEWCRNLELELLRIAPNAEITDIEYTDPDRYLEQPVKITYKYRIPDYATVDKEVISFIPLSARGFYSRAMSHLYFDFSQEQRKQPFSDRCSRLVDIRETITLPFAPSQMHYPMVDGVADPAASFGCGFQLNGDKLTFGEQAVFGKRVYDAADWLPFRASAMAQLKVAETPVILTK